MTSSCTGSCLRIPFLSICYVFLSFWGFPIVTSFTPCVPKQQPYATVPIIIQAYHSRSWNQQQTTTTLYQGKAVDNPKRNKPKRNKNKNKKNKSKRTIHLKREPNNTTACLTQEEPKTMLSDTSVTSAKTKIRTTTDIDAVVDKVHRPMTTGTKTKPTFPSPTTLSAREKSPQVVPTSGFNIILTHCTADFDSLASAVGLAKLWSVEHTVDGEEDDGFDSCVSEIPTFVVLPRGAHPGVAKFLALHKHLFPICSLKSLPMNDLSGLNRLGLVDAQRRDRIGPASCLLEHAKQIVIVDHHMDNDSDIIQYCKEQNIPSSYIIDKVGSVSTLIVERIQKANLPLTEVEATVLALGIHADTGSLCFDSTTPRDVLALGHVMSQGGASQIAIAEHAKSSLSYEQQNVLTQTLMNVNVTKIHGVSISTVLLGCDDGFINGLAAVTQDALELSSSDIFLLALVYEAESGGASKKRKKLQQQSTTSRSSTPHEEIHHVSKLDTHHHPTMTMTGTATTSSSTTTMIDHHHPPIDQIMYAEAWMGGEEVLRRRRLRIAFDRFAIGSDYIEHHEIASAIASSGMIATKQQVKEFLKVIEATTSTNHTTTNTTTTTTSAKSTTTTTTTNRTTTADSTKNSNVNTTIPINNKIDFEEFVALVEAIEKKQKEAQMNRKTWTMILIGRVKAGVHTKSVKLNKLLEQYGGGGHPKAASATIRLNNEFEAEGILQNLVNELIDTNLQKQQTVGDFMTAPVLSVKPNMNEKQVEDLFKRYDTRALPVVDDTNDVIGLVTYKEVAAAKQRQWNKEQKQLRRERELANKKPNEKTDIAQAAAKHEQRAKTGSIVKSWMKQHIQTVEASRTMAEVEAILLETDVGCIPVVADGTMQLVGMVTRTDLLRQHRYYPSLHYHNKGFSDSIAARQPIIQLRKKLKKFDIEEE